VDQLQPELEQEGLWNVWKKDIKGPQILLTEFSLSGILITLIELFQTFILISTQRCQIAAYSYREWDLSSISLWETG
jgi:hypothetical protein